MYSIDDYNFSVFDPNKKYHLHIDADTLVMACAVVIDKEPCVVKHNRSGRKKTFESFSAFIDFLENDEKGKNFTIKDFDVPCIGFAFSNFNSKLNAVLDHKWIGDYTLYLGGKDNFRKELYLEYKASRKKSPPMRKFVHDYVCWKYRERVVEAHGAEAEDFCLAAVMEDIDNHICAMVDKDLTTQSGLFFNYQKMDKGVFFINKIQAFYNLCCQLLHGDRSTDNIVGINFISKEIKEKYGVGGKSIGEATAMKLLDDVKHDKLLMKERVADIYKLSYGESWKEALQFTGSLVFISKIRDEYFSVDKFLRGVIND